MKTVAIVQARMGSSRYPGKVMKHIGGEPMIGLLLKRLGLSREVDQVVLATSTKSIDDPLEDYVKSQGVDVIRGSESDVLDRFYTAAKASNAEVVIRITGDCPLVDSQLVDEAVSRFKKSDADYLTNTAPATYPDGLDIEVFSFDALEEAARSATKEEEREHVTPYIRCSKTFKSENFSNKSDLSAQRWTVDEPSDFEVITNVFEHFAPDIAFSWQKVAGLQEQKPDLFKHNQHLVRNEGGSMGQGQKLWRRAKNVIAGGNMLLSKRPEMFLPEKWPAYYSKAKGCQVWDLDGNEYTDMSIMGIGTNVLGYCHPEVDEVAHAVVKQSNMSTFNCPEEVYLAERLVELHPWADMVKFARSGGEANAIAVRIARAASGKDKVAICGYHGWHDWYLSANLSQEEALSGHLLPGLEPKGVPRDLAGTVIPFEYNDFQGLLDIVDKHDIGVIKMEVSRNHGPENGFLDKIRALASERNIVLIFDECTSGFRQSFGGLHKIYGVEPDMAVFGKTLGNGYAISAVIGTQEVMSEAQATFISSTFWTERLGPAAALKTLEVMEQTRSWEVITSKGEEIRKRWQQVADLHGLGLSHWGLPALTGFTINSDNALKYKTYITQEMLKKGMLAANSVYASITHTDEIINNYFELVEPVFEVISQCENGEKDIDELLESPVCHSGFKRLN